MTGDDLAAAAEALVGSRFRLHGRDPATGLDCIGVLAAALAGCGSRAALPTGYRLHARGLPDLAALAADCGFVAATGPIAAGDVLIVRVGTCQFHLLIAGTGGGFVHAHAGRRRVIVSPGPLAWPLAGHWRPGPTI